MPWNACVTSSKPLWPTSRAAVYPNETDYYYFAAGKDGVNHFFKTYNEHLAFINSDMYQPD